MRLFLPNDIQTIDGWYRDHGQIPVPLDALPAVGFIVEGVAAGFLFRTDSSMGLIHNIISNPKSDKALRAQAIRDIIGACLDVAKANGLRGIVSWSVVDSIINAAKECGATCDRQVNLIEKQLR